MHDREESDGRVVPEKLPNNAQGRSGGGRGDVGGLRAGSRGEPSGFARSGSQGRLPGEAVAEGVHTEAGRAAAAARGRLAGGQDPPAGGGRGVERRVRGGLSRVLLRVSARAQTA